MESLKYISTRGHQEALSFSEAVVRGIAPDGGLYVPTELPANSLAGINGEESYAVLAQKVMAPFADFGEGVLEACTNGAYDSKFSDPSVAPLVTFDNTSFLELYHGRTLAFKDMALSILPRFMTAAAKQLEIKDEIVVLTATSGDTGKAALEGFADIPGTRIVVFYPTDGVSDVQKHQMVTQEGDNVMVMGIRGNFDDAQNGVKAIFSDEGLGRKLKDRGFVFSSANSINIGRLVPQIVYYVHSWLQLKKQGKIVDGESFNVVVPTGNFGNILAAWYAKEMGVPIKKFICASNVNNVLTDFIRTGKYDMNRPFHTTASPSMDILISSNLERLVFELTGRSGEKTAALMADLKKEGTYELGLEMKAALGDFYGGYADDAETVAAIRDCYSEKGYVMDTHTAVAYKVLEDYRKETGDKTHAVIASTASPYKFTRSVVEGMGISTEGLDDFQLIEILSEKSGMVIPEPIQGLKDRAVLYPGVCDKDVLAYKVLEFLGI